MDTDGTWMLIEPDDDSLYSLYDRGYWTTKDGRNLKIELMETSHIKNTINLLKRNITKLVGEEKDYYEDYFNFKISEFEKELKKRDIYSKHILESKGE